ncbi:MAG: AMP-binding protein [Polyangiaceae bacterium]|nr:AMP-binding protein [Polyangiaceae bacterium]
MESLSVTDTVREHAERTFLVTEGRSFSFGEAAERATESLSTLTSLGASPGRGVRFVASATPAVIWTILACLEGGVPLIPLHPRWSDAEKARARQLVPDALEIDPEELTTSRSRAPRSTPCSARERTADPEQLAAVLFTSGTSAAPKGVQLARRCFTASARAHAANAPFLRDDRWLLAMPLSHAGGLSIVTRALASRTGIVLVSSSDPDAWLSSLARGRATLASVVPAGLARLLDADRGGAMTSLRAVLVGGAPFDPSLRRRAADAGVRALATYGLTETCSQVATQPLGAPREPGSRDSGRALAGAEVQARGRRLWVRGDMVMLGYVGAAPVPRGAWLDTGDEGEVGPDGVLWVAGRADDTIVTGGENVHPSEVERALTSSPFVIDAVVFGVDDPTWGQLVCVALVLAEGAEPRSALAIASAGLAPFKRPRRFVVVEQISPDGAAKVSRRQLASTLAGRLEPMSYERASR